MSITVVVTPELYTTETEAGTTVVESPLIEVTDVGSVPGIQGPVGPDGNRYVTDTYTTLRALAGGSYAEVMVTGTATTLTGVNGIFAWDEDSVADDNAGTVIEPDAGGTGRWKRIYDNALNLRWFGARGDGVTNDTDAWQAAVAALNAITTGARSLYVPTGTYLINAFASAAADADDYTLPDGTLLYGDGPLATIFKARPDIHNADIAEGSAWRLIRAGSNSVMGGFGVDGNRAAFTQRTGGLNSKIQGVTISEGSADSHIERVNVYECASFGIEGFGMSVTKSHRCTVRDCVTYDNDGTGLHVIGTWTDVADDTDPPPTTALADDIVISGHRSYRNGWSGCSIFRTKRVMISGLVSEYNGTAADDLGNGLNLEFVEDVKVTNATLRYNYRANLTLALYGNRNQLTNLTTYQASNATYWGGSSTQSGEIRIGPGNVGTPDDPASSDAGTAHNVLFTNCFFTPRTGGNHIQWGASLLTPTHGTSVPQVAFINCWDNAGLSPSRWTHDMSSAATPRLNGTFIVRDAPAIRQVETPALTSASGGGYTKTSLTVTSEARAGSNNATVYKCLTGAAAGRWGYVLPSQYGVWRFSARIQPGAAGDTLWHAFASGTGSTLQVSSFRHTFRSTDLSTWFDVHVFYAVPNGSTTVEVRQQGTADVQTWYVDGQPTLTLIDGLGAGV